MTPPGLRETGEIIQLLSEVPDDALDRIVKAAKAFRAKTAKDRIPQKVKDSLVAKHDRLMQGQSTSIIVKPEIQFTFTVKGHKDWEDIDWEVKLLNDGDRRSKALFDLYDMSLVCLDDPWCDLPKLEPHLHEMREQESKINEAWEDDYHHLRNEYGVNAWDLVEEIKEGDSPSPELSQ
jgi:hypothetical protein